MLNTRQTVQVKPDGQPFHKRGISPRVSAFHDIDRKAAGRRLLVLVMHVGTGLAHRLDTGIERYQMCAIALDRQRGGFKFEVRLANDTNGLSLRKEDAMKRTYSHIDVE